MFDKIIGTNMKETICAIILTKNEDIHLSRILDQLSKLMDNILIVDSGSTDQTSEITKKYNCDFIFNKWKNHAAQFNFGINYLKNKYNWIIRVDADEYFDDLEILAKLVNQIKNGHYKKINGISFYRRIHFLGYRIKYGGVFPISIVRLFRSGYGLCEERWMDEHIVVSGKIIHEKLTIIDDNKMGFEFWLNKHISYAKREAIEMLFIEYGHTKKDKNFKNSLPTIKKRNIKENYYSKLPLFLRPTLYFLYRYFIRIGFLDGKMGFLFHFFHAFWYRMVVDLFVFRVMLLIKTKNININKAIKEVLQIDA